MTPARGLTAFFVVAIAATAAWFLLDDGNAPPSAVGGSAHASSTQPDDRPLTAPSPIEDDPNAAKSSDITERSLAEGEPAASDNSSASASEKADAKVTVHGRVVDESGSPLRGIPVSCRFSFGFGFLTDNPGTPTVRNATTDSDGSFTFDDLPAGNVWTVTAIPMNLTAAKARVPADARGETNLGDLIVKLGGSLSGIVRDENGQPIDNATVEAYTQRNAGSGGLSVFTISDIGSQPDRTTTTDASGAFRIDGMESGLAVVLASKDGFAHESVRDIRVDRGEVSRDVELSLSRGRSISGVVVDDRGAPAVGAKVSVMETIIDLGSPGASTSFGSERKVAVGANGHFTIDGLKDLSYNITAKRDGFLPNTASEIEAGTDDVRITLKQSGMVFGYVVDARTDEAIEDFKVIVRRAGMISMGDHDLLGFGGAAKILTGQEAARRAGVESSEGLFVAVDLPSTSVDVRVDAPGFSPWKHGPVRVQSGDQVRADAELVPERIMTGIVKAPDGSPLSGARVSIGKAQDAGEFGGSFSVRMRVTDDGGGPTTEMGSGYKSATTDEKGEFVVKGITSGDFDVSARHDEWAPSESVRVTVGDRDPDLVTLVMKAGGALEGVTFDSEGNILPRATVSLTRKRSNSGRGAGPGGLSSFGGTLLGNPFGGGGGDLSTSSDGDGVYSLRGVTPGDYVATIKKTNDMGGGSSMIVQLSGMGGKGPDGAPVTIEEGLTAYQDLHLPPTGRIEGRVMANGSPIADAGIRLVDPSAHFPMPIASAKSDDSGRFSLEDVKPGEYALKISVPDAGLPIERDVKVRPRDTAREEIHLPTGAIRGRVTDTDSGDPLPGVIVDVQRPRNDSDTGSPSAPQGAVGIVMMRSVDDSGGGMTQMSFGNEEETLVTDSEGYYHVRYLEAGPYQVSIRGEGVMKETLDSVQVLEGQERANVDFNAKRGGKVTVQIVPPEGKELGFFRAEMIPAADPASPDTKMEAGTSTTTFDGLAPGRYTLKVSSQSLKGEQTFDLLSGEVKPLTIRLE